MLHTWCTRVFWPHVAHMPSSVMCRRVFEGPTVGQRASYDASPPRGCRGRRCEGGRGTSVGHRNSLYDRARRLRDDSPRVGSSGSKQTAPAACWAFVDSCLLRRRRSPLRGLNRREYSTRPTRASTNGCAGYCAGSVPTEGRCTVRIAPWPKSRRDWTLFGSTNTSGVGAATVGL
jgi:hypothetical protein